jgi:hypothetical protein
MTVSGVGTIASFMSQSLIDLRRQLDDLQRQISTGQKVIAYSGISSQSQLVVGLNSQLDAISSFRDSNKIVDTRLAIAQTALTQFDSTARSVGDFARLSNYTPRANGQTVDQLNAGSQFGQLLSLLNTQADNGYIFSGTALNQPATATPDVILNGTATQAGLKQVISERNQADLGTNGLGRLVLPATSTSPARLIGSGATLAPDAVATIAGTQDISALSSAGGTLVINGTSITINAGDNAAAIKNRINLQSGTTKVSASTNATNQLVLTSADANTAVAIGGATTPGLLTEFGLAVGTTNPTNLLTQGLAGKTLTITVGANPTLTLNFGAGQVSTLAGLATALGALVGGTASVNTSNGNVSIVATNTTDTIAVGGTAALSTFGIPAALGTQTPGNRVALSEDVAGSPFGFKLASASSTLTGANLIGPTGTPPGIAVDLSVNPSPGDALNLTFNLPDGTTQQLTMTATTTTPPGLNAFTVGATPAATAANLQAALTNSVRTLAATQLTAASSVQAAHNFFDVSPTQTAQRVVGPAFATATALVNATAANTVSWYTGAMAANPRTSVTARIDFAATVSYGIQANEPGLRSAIENVAVFAAASFQIGNPNSSAAYAALSQRVGRALFQQPGQQSTADIEAELANAQISIKNATSQHQQSQAQMQDSVQGITGISNEQVAAELATVQVQLQASLQTTAMLTKLSLLNYLGPA